VLFAIFIGNVVEIKFGLSPIISFFIGIASSIILAQVKIYRFLVDFLLKVAFSPDLWYVRLIIWVVIIGVIVLLFYIMKVFEKYLKGVKESNEKKSTKHRRKLLSRFTKGAGLE